MGNLQVKKLADAYNALADALDGFDWGEPQRCVLGSFTVNGRPGEDVHSELVGNVWIDLPKKTLGRSPVEAEVCHIVNKPTFGSYMLPSDILDELMAHNKAVTDLEKIVIYGYCTDICVISNAMVLRAAFPETEIEILSDCCAGVTPDTHRTALDAMRACQFTIL